MTFTEILETIARRTNTQNTTTSSYTIAQKTLDVNSALNWYFILANSSAGNWRPVDDTNQTDYPIVYADIVSGQQDYSFTLDENDNQILDIYKIRIKDATSGEWTTLQQINQDTISDSDLSTLVSGIPTQYYLTANGIFLVQKPNFSLTDGLEIWVNRTPTYFLTSDTTKKPGIPYVHHEYLVLRPAYFYCLDKGLPQASDLRVQLYGNDGNGGMEKRIKEYFKKRNKDFQQSITNENINSI